MYIFNNNNNNKVRKNGLNNYLISQKIFWLMHMGLKFKMYSPGKNQIPNLIYNCDYKKSNIWLTCIIMIFFKKLKKTNVHLIPWGFCLFFWHETQQLFEVFEIPRTGGFLNLIFFFSNTQTRWFFWFWNCVKYLEPAFGWFWFFQCPEPVGIIKINYPQPHWAFSYNGTSGAA